MRKNGGFWGENLGFGTGTGEKNSEKFVFLGGSTGGKRGEEARFTGDPPGRSVNSSKYTSDCYPVFYN